MKFVLRFFGHRRLAALTLALFVNALLDLAGIVILYPYLKLATNPAQVVGDLRLQPWLDRFGIESLSQFVLLAGIGLVLFYTIKLGLVYTLNRYQFRATADLTFRLTEEMYTRLLRCRYSAFQEFPASQLIGVVYNNPIHAAICLTAIVTIFNDALFLVMMMLISITVSPIATVVSMTLLFLIGAWLQVTVVRRTQRFGKQQAKAEDIKHKLAFATIAAIKDIKVMGIEEHIRGENSEISREFFATTWKFNLLGSVPKMAIEYFIFLGLCLSIFIFVGMKRDAADLIPMVAVGIAALMRILPSFGRMIAALNAFKFYRPFIAKITDFYEKTEAFELNVVDRRMPFEKLLEAKDIGFSYGEKRILSNITISIPKGHAIGIVGMSGSGKSTFLDLLSGIQEKGAGEFYLDGQVVDPFRTNAVRRMLGYVPQTIALMDDSIAFNVSFSREWDSNKLMRALRIANLWDFVDQLPEKEQTTVGENGVRLSGGQRQRIGIARALYKDPQILIFDEATSAVDNITEQELTREIKGLAGTKTLVIVAHRLSTIQHCDRIYIIQNGENAGSGTYRELLEDNAFFQELHKQQAGETRS